MRLFLLSLCCAAVLPAQNISSGLSATVLDPAGAVIAGAQIKLTSEDKGFVRTGTTNHNGFFSFPDLMAATFTLEINAPGFKTYRQTGIELNSSEQRSLGEVRLQLGEVSDTVTVSAEVAQVNTATGEKAGVRNAEELTGLALPPTCRPEAMSEKACCAGRVPTTGTSRSTRIS